MSTRSVATSVGARGPATAAWAARRIAATLGVAAAMLAALWAATACADGGAAARTGFDLSRHKVPVGALLNGGPPKDGIPALSDPPALRAQVAIAMEPEDLVVGVALGAETRAYPLRILSYHEIANDRLGGIPIAVTYCPLTGSVLVFDRRVGGSELDFGVSGLLYQSNLVMFDRQSESLWSQLGEEGVTGERMGSRLRRIPSTVTSWKQWLERNPDTTVLSESTGYPRNYRRDPYSGYAESNWVRFPVAHLDSRLAIKRKVVGVLVGDKARAYPLLRGGAETGLPDADTLGAVEVHPAVDGVGVYWFAWAAFHPETDIYGLPSDDAEPQRVADAVVSHVEASWQPMHLLFLGAGSDATPFSSGSLFVIRGELRNRSDRPIRRVVLRYEFVDADGASVYYQEGCNRAAEPLLASEDNPPGASEAVSLPPGASDGFRMIFFGEELPRFTRYEVSVVEVR